MKRRVRMTKKRVLAFMVWIPLLTLGCNAKSGTVALDTIPTAATVYVNEAKWGETPTTFGLDLQRPVTLKILKEGYLPQTEILNVPWAQQEYRAGHYTQHSYMVGKVQEKSFYIRTVRVLQEDVNARRLGDLNQENARRLQEFTTWGNSVVGKDYHEVVDRLGLPGETIDMPNGNKTMIFNRGFLDAKPKFETDPSGIVVGWTF
jgi:hypothetical protein